MISFINDVFKSILIIHVTAVCNVAHLHILMILFIVFYKVFSVFHVYFSIFTAAAACFSYCVKLTLIYLNLKKSLHINNAD